jgi:hypothetical protein
MESGSGLGRPTRRDRNTGVHLAVLGTLGRDMPWRSVLLPTSSHKLAPARHSSAHCQERRGSRREQLAGGAPN